MVSYRDFNPSASSDISLYLMNVTSQNRVFQYQISSFLENFAGTLNSSDYAIVTTGSDGRCEKRTLLSPLELIVLFRTDIDESIRSKVETAIGEKPELFDPVVEYKTLEDPSVFYETDKNLVFPGRALDSRYLIGNRTIARAYKSNLVLDLHSDDGRKIVQKFSKSKGYHRKILETSMDPRGNKHFDLDNGIIYLEPSKHIMGPKLGHLRTSQYSTTLEILKGVRAKKIDEDMLLEMPGGFVDRLNFLFYADLLNKNFSEGEKNTVIEAYVQSLYWYHLLEENFEKTKETQIEVNSGLFKDCTKILGEFSRRPNLIKVK